MTIRRPWAVALASTLLVAACSTMTATSANAAHVRDAMRDHRFPKACEELWVDALKVIASEGYGLVGKDRELAGQEQQGFVTNFLNRGHATTRDDNGVFEAESDADAQFVRFVVRGKPAGEGGCFVQYISVLDDRTNSTERRHRDYDLELKLLTRVDPVAAARIAEAADNAK